MSTPVCFALKEEAAPFRKIAAGRLAFPPMPSGRKFHARIARNQSRCQAALKIY
jgi:hypothetical protein